MRVRLHASARIAYRHGQQKERTRLLERQEVLASCFDTGKKGPSRTAKLLFGPSPALKNETQRLRPSLWVSIRESRQLLFCCGPELE